MMCYVDFKALDKHSRYVSLKDRQTVFDESNKLVTEVLPLVAKNIFKAWVVAYADVNKFGIIGVNLESTMNKFQRAPFIIQDGGGFQYLRVIHLV